MVAASISDARKETSGLPEPSTAWNQIVMPGDKVAGTVALHPLHRGLFDIRTDVLPADH